MTSCSSGLAVVLLAAALAAPQAPKAAQAGPEIFDVVATASATRGAAGAVTVPIVIRIDRYTPEHELTRMSDALKFRGGYPGFLQALREAPAAGTLEVAGNTFDVRWARQVTTATGRTLSFVTDKPVFFVGAGTAGAKSTAGYEVAVVQFTLDAKGHGTGTMAAAARVKPGGETGVRIDNYAAAPLRLTAVVRVKP